MFTRKGRITSANGPIAPSAPLWLVQDLHDALAVSFGSGVARVACNALCFPPYSLPPLYAVGTRKRLDLLWSIIGGLGVFRDGAGFYEFGALDAPDDFSVIDAGDRGPSSSGVPPVAAAGVRELSPVKSLYAAADLPPHCLLANDAVAISLPPSGGYAMYLRGLDGWGLVHSDMPACILLAKVVAVYPDLFSGLAASVSSLPEPEELAPFDRLSFIQSFVG